MSAAASKTTNKAKTIPATESSSGQFHPGRYDAQAASDKLLASVPARYGHVGGPFFPPRKTPFLASLGDSKQQPHLLSSASSLPLIVPVASSSSSSLSSSSSSFSRPLGLVRLRHRLVPSSSPAAEDNAHTTHALLKQVAMLTDKIEKLSLDKMVCEERARQEVRAERLEYIEELEATSKRDKERIHALEAQVARLETEKREHERDVKPAISGQAFLAAFAVTMESSIAEQLKHEDDGSSSAPVSF